MSSTRGKLWRVEVPDGLAWWRERPGGAAWLERLPRLAAECAELWGLRLEPPFEPASVSLVVPAGDAVLKLNFPEPESEHEADALAAWGGEGAVRLLARDAERSALLVERCRPGTQLWAVADEEPANSLMAEVMPRLWRPPGDGHPFATLADAAAEWLEDMRDYPPLEPDLMDLARALAPELAASQGEGALLHQDLHGGNLLLDAERGWLAIDPKPLVGDREFDTASLLRDRRDELARDPRPAARIRRRLDQLSGDLELDRERMRLWGIVHAVAWGGPSGGEWNRMSLACARWLAEA